MSYLAKAKRILAEQCLEPVEDTAEPGVYYARTLCTSTHGVSVVEHRPYSGDGGFSWEKVVQPQGEESVVELAGPQTTDPLVAAGWVELIGGTERARLFREEWGLTGGRQG